MSETSSDAESSCGWTIITNEGSDIETLLLEAVVDYGTELSERPPVEESELQDTHASALAECDETLRDQTMAETLFCSQDRDDAAGKEQVTLLSSSDHSDIMTLRDTREDEHADVEDEAAASEESYLGTSCSSQYAFTAADTAGLIRSHWTLPQSLLNLGKHLRSQLTGGRSFTVFPVKQQAATNTSSSEDETGPSSSTVLRRRRVRRNTTSTLTEPQEETLESGLHQDHDREDDREEVKEEDREDDREEKQQETGVRPPDDVRVRGRCRSIVHTCVVLALVVGACMSFSRLYGTQQIPEEPELFVCLGSDVDPEEPFLNQALKEDADHHHENQEINIKQAQRDDSEMFLKQKATERTSMMAEQQRLTAENQQLSTLQEELRHLRSKLSRLEKTGAGVDSVRSENQRLKEQLEEKKQAITNVHVQREELMAEAQTLKKKLEEERKVTHELRSELNDLRSDVHGSGAEELQSRLTELEKRLGFEKQRSDLWERLYVENKDRAKGDAESTVKRPKKGMAGKVQETFDAVKNSTKEFVHHHKEQIKKAKEAVKENLRKFSDSVKSTFRHFKNSASTLMNKARGFCHGKCDGRDPNAKESWQHRAHRPQNTRKPGHKVHQDRGPNMKGCSGVLDCAYQESTSLFNRAMEPITADEFYQLLQSYVQQEVDHFHHWKELERFINNFFHNGVFIHDQMLFTDFVSGVEEYLADMREYQGLHGDVFGDLDDYVYRHFFGDAYAKHYSPRRPFEKPVTDSKEEVKSRHHQRRQQRARSRPRSGGNSERHMADVKIEVGPLPFDPKY
ncbi:cell cycle progression protein 1 isoform X7 [Solea solea]|uniref:cell cycle progression protein 1 isoform X7 n=1 Tax=Solea solea TaxID=90069 RepID=UPI00272AB3CD|nr:cell cycle progression protein 1 isoform X7 [Solea solea]